MEALRIAGFAMPLRLAAIPVVALSCLFGRYNRSTNVDAVVLALTNFQARKKHIAGAYKFAPSRIVGAHLGDIMDHSSSD